MLLERRRGPSPDPDAGRERSDLTVVGASRGARPRSPRPATRGRPRRRPRRSPSPRRSPARRMHQTTPTAPATRPPDCPRAGSPRRTARRASHGRPTRCGRLRLARHAASARPPAASPPRNTGLPCSAPARFPPQRPSVERPSCTTVTAARRSRRVTPIPTRTRSPAARARVVRGAGRSPTSRRSRR